MCTDNEEKIFVVGNEICGYPYISSIQNLEALLSVWMCEVAKEVSKIRCNSHLIFDLLHVPFFSESQQLVILCTLRNTTN